MKINSKFLSLPPHISTSWKNITSIQLINEHGLSVLAIILMDGHIIKIPGLPKEIVEQVFIAHSEFLEMANEQEPALSSNNDHVDFQKVAMNMGVPMQFSLDGFQGFGAMQHNPEQANLPSLPPEILTKIASVAKALGMEEAGVSIPDAQPHCNCTYCQIARAMKGEQPTEEKALDIDEPVDDIELSFREFDIEQTGDNLYTVTNPLDQSEHFQVFLGEPIGCTCGKKNCEHIKAVLNS
ncbi:MAG: hypothetical protein K9M07_03940 [Simkaniaceae bacterium]|nr:hypothetical protein [Simkaniaceae bacterium]MCF7852378.1 hypothetical protein [Simkaniaceae bacterium]